MAAYLEPLSSLLATSLATLPDPDSSLRLSPLPSRPSSTADLGALQGAVQSSLLPALPALPSWQPLLEALSQLRHSLYPLQHLPYPPSLGNPPPCSPDTSTVTSAATAALATAASLCATAPQPDGPTSAALSPLLLEVLGAAALCASRRLAVDAYAALCSGSGSAGCWRALCSSRQLPLTHPASPARLRAVLDCHSVFQRQCASLCALLSPPLPQPPLTPDAQCLLATAALVLPLREGTGALPPPPLHSATAATCYLAHLRAQLAAGALAACSAEELAAHALRADRALAGRLAQRCPVGSPLEALDVHWAALDAYSRAVGEEVAVWHGMTQIVQQQLLPPSHLAWGVPSPANTLPATITLAHAHGAVARLAAVLPATQLSGLGSGSLGPPAGSLQQPHTWPAALRDLQLAITSAQQLAGAAGLDAAAHPYLAAAQLLHDLRALVLQEEGQLLDVLRTLSPSTPLALPSLEALLLGTLAGHSSAGSSASSGAVARCASVLLGLFANLGLSAPEAAQGGATQPQPALERLPQPCLAELLLVFSALATHRTSTYLCAALSTETASTRPLAQALEAAHAVISLLPGVLAAAVAAAGEGSSSTGASAQEHPSALLPCLTLSSLVRLGGGILTCRAAVLTARSVLASTTRQPLNQHAAAVTAALSDVELALSTSILKGDAAVAASPTTSTAPASFTLPLPLAASLPVDIVQCAERELTAAAALVAVERACLALQLAMEQGAPTVAVLPREEGGHVLLQWPPAAARGSGPRGYSESLRAALALLPPTLQHSAAAAPRATRRLAGLVRATHALIAACSALVAQLSDAAAPFDAAAFAVLHPAPPPLLALAQYALHAFTARALTEAVERGLGAVPLDAAPAAAAAIDSTPLTEALAACTQLASNAGAGAGSGAVLATDTAPPPMLPCTQALCQLVGLLATVRALLLAESSGLQCASLEGAWNEASEVLAAAATPSAAAPSFRSLPVPARLAAAVRAELRAALLVRAARAVDGGLVKALQAAVQVGEEGLAEQAEARGAAACAALQALAERSPAALEAGLQAVFAEAQPPPPCSAAQLLPWSQCTPSYLGALAMAEALHRSHSSGSGSGTGVAWRTLQLLSSVHWVSSAGAVISSPSHALLLPCGPLPAPPSALLPLLSHPLPLPPPSSTPPTTATAAWESLVQRMQASPAASPTAPPNLHTAALPLFRCTAHAALVEVCAGLLPTLLHLLTLQVHSALGGGGGSAASTSTSSAVGLELSQALTWYSACLAAAGSPHTLYLASSEAREGHCALRQGLQAVRALAHAAAAIAAGQWEEAAQGVALAAEALVHGLQGSSAAEGGSGGGGAAAAVLTRLLACPLSAALFHPPAVFPPWLALWEACVARLTLEGGLLGHSEREREQGCAALVAHHKGSAPSDTVRGILTAMGSGRDSGGSARSSSAQALECFHSHPPTAWPAYLTASSAALPSPASLFTRAFLAASAAAEAQAALVCTSELQLSLRCGGDGLQEAQEHAVAVLERGLQLPPATLQLLHTCRGFGILRRGAVAEAAGGGAQQQQQQQHKQHTHAHAPLASSPWAEAAGRVMEGEDLAGVQGGEEMGRVLAVQRLSACGGQLLALLQGQGEAVEEGLKADTQAAAAAVLSLHASPSTPAAATAAAAATALVSTLLPTTLQVLTMRSIAGQVDAAFAPTALHSQEPASEAHLLTALAQAESCAQSVQSTVQPCPPWLLQADALLREAAALQVHLGFVRALRGLQLACKEGSAGSSQLASRVKAAQAALAAVEEEDSSSSGSALPPSSRRQQHLQRSAAPTFQALLRCALLLQALHSQGGSGAPTATFVWANARQQLSLPPTAKEHSLPDLLQASLLPTSPTLVPSTGYPLTAALVSTARLAALDARAAANLCASYSSWCRLSLARALGLPIAQDSAAAAAPAAAGALPLESLFPVLEAFSQSPLLQQPATGSTGALHALLASARSTLVPVLALVEECTTTASLPCAAAGQRWGRLGEALRTLHSHPALQLLPQDLQALHASALAQANHLCTLCSLAAELQRSSEQLQLPPPAAQQWHGIEAAAALSGVLAVRGQLSAWAGDTASLTPQQAALCSSLRAMAALTLQLREGMAELQGSSAPVSGALESAVAAAEGCPPPQPPPHAHQPLTTTWSVLRRELAAARAMAGALRVERGALQELLASPHFADYREASLATAAAPLAASCERVQGAWAEAVAVAAQGPLTALGQGLLAAAASMLPLRKAFTAVVAAWGAGGEEEEPATHTLALLPMRQLLSAWGCARRAALAAAPPSALPSACAAEVHSATAFVEEQLFHQALAGALTGSSSSEQQQQQQHTEQPLGSLLATVESLLSSSGYSEPPALTLRHFSPAAATVYSAAQQAAALQRLRLGSGSGSSSSGSTPEAMLLALQGCAPPAGASSQQAELFTRLLAPELQRLSAQCEGLAALGSLQAALGGVGAWEGVGCLWAVRGSPGALLLPSVQAQAQPLAVEAAALEGAAVVRKHSGEQGVASLQQLQALLPVGRAVTALRRAALGVGVGVGRLEAGQQQQHRLQQAVENLLAAGEGAFLAMDAAAALSPLCLPAELSAFLAAEAALCTAHASLYLSLLRLASEMQAHSCSGQDEEEEGGAAAAAAAAAASHHGLAIVLPVGSETLGLLAELQGGGLPPTPTLPTHLLLPDVTALEQRKPPAHLLEAHSQAMAALQLSPAPPPSPPHLPPTLHAALTFLCAVLTTLQACRGHLVCGRYAACEQAAGALVEGAAGVGGLWQWWGGQGEGWRREAQLLQQLAAGVQQRTAAVRGLGEGLAAAQAAAAAAGAQSLQRPVLLAQLLQCLQEVARTGAASDPVLQAEARQLVQAAVQLLRQGVGGGQA